MITNNNERPRLESKEIPPHVMIYSNKIKSAVSLTTMWFAAKSVLNRSIPSTSPIQSLLWFLYFSQIQRECLLNILIIFS